MARKLKVHKDIRPILAALERREAKRDGWEVVYASKKHIAAQVLHRGKVVTVIKTMSEDPRAVRNIKARLRRLGAPVGR